jgi:hypothetical protein
LSGLALRAQVALDSIPITGDWESAGYIVDNTDMRVEIEYRLQKNSCDATGFGNTNHQFRFKIEALKKPLGFDRYLSFKIMFEDCFGIKICKTVNLNVGIRQKNDVWDGIQPLSDPNLDNSFTGRSLIKAFYDVNLRWEKDPTKDSECLLVEEVKPAVSKPKPVVSAAKIQSSFDSETALPKAKPRMKYELATSIGIKAYQLNCPGGEVAFYPVGGKIDSLVKYHWTKSSCEGEQVGIGDTLVVSPMETTKYFVKLIGDSYTSACISVDYKVKQLPVVLPTFTKTVLADGAGIRIDIDHAGMVDNFPVAWYRNTLEAENRLSSKSYILEDPSFSAGDKYYYRFESSCDTSAITVVTFPEVEVPRKNRFYVGAGIISGGNSAFQPFSVMVGFGPVDRWKIYARMKKTSLGTLGNVSPTLVANNLKITNYPINTNTYYIITNKVAAQRDSYTIGFMKEYARMSIYGGVGIGNSQVYWNAETYGYANPGLRLSNTWVKNKSQSAGGVEVEGGATLKIQNFNLQGGVNVIRGENGLFISADFGIGITF